MPGAVIAASSAGPGAKPVFQLSPVAKSPPLGFVHTNGSPAVVTSVKSSDAEPVLPAASVSSTTMVWSPAPDSVTSALQLPSLPTATVPICVPLSNSVTVEPMAASAAVTLPVIVCVVWSVRPPAVSIATVGGRVSRVKLSEAVVELLPATSVNCAETCLPPSAPRSPAATVRLTLPAVTSAAVMVCVTGCASAEPPSSNCTVSPTATVGLRATVKVGATTLVMSSVCEAPESEAAVKTGALPVGAVVSSVKLSEAVPMLPNASVWLATTVCVPSASPLGVNDQFPSASVVAVAVIAVPSTVKCTALLAKPVPLNASLEVMWSAADKPVSNVRLSVTVGPVSATVTVRLAAVWLPLASVTCAVIVATPLASAV